ncbi:conserved hypothetical protein [Nitrosomonas nitrosa]|uniref:Uncharacterized protein n=1 Tax=Nitrosomonas nitrosa TaxID=52442 RepID=A0A8H8Z118_9PROT|nr:conserved hypothetical protein [Nitrosomonas nitrosa]
MVVSKLPVRQRTLECFHQSIGLFSKLPVRQRTRAVVDL